MGYFTLWKADLNPCMIMDPGLQQGVTKNTHPLNLPHYLPIHPIDSIQLLLKHTPYWDLLHCSERDGTLAAQGVAFFNINKYNQVSEMKTIKR